MTMEITALRARLVDLEEGNLNLKKQIRKEVQEDYEDLVKTLFTACLHVKVSDLCRASGQACGEREQLHGGHVQQDQQQNGLWRHKNSPALSFLHRAGVSSRLSLFYHDRH